MYSIYNELLEKKILAPLEGIVEGMKENGDEVKHFVAHHGLSSIPKYFINKAGL